MPERRLEVDFGVWGMVRQIAIVCVVLVILGGMSLWYVPVIRQTRSLEKEIDGKREALQRQYALHQKYEAEIAALKTDPETVERAIREKLGLAKPHEVIFRFDPPLDEKKESRP